MMLKCNLTVKVKEINICMDKSIGRYPQYLSTNIQPYAWYSVSEAIVFFLFVPSCLNHHAAIFFVGVRLWFPLFHHQIFRLCCV